MCADGQKIIVAYIFRHAKRDLACERCDCVLLWPNFTRTSPPITKE